MVGLEDQVMTDKDFMKTALFNAAEKLGLHRQRAMITHVLAERKPPSMLALCVSVPFNVLWLSYIVLDLGFREYSRTRLVCLANVHLKCLLLIR